MNVGGSPQVARLDCVFLFRPDIQFVRLGACSPGAEVEWKPR